jgi:cyclopropane-fatty-acyl-phospholipid synthase
MALSTRDRQHTQPAFDDISVEVSDDCSPAAEVLEPLLTSLFGDRPDVRVVLWDGGAFGPDDASVVLHVQSSDALRRLLWAPDQIGLGRAYVAGELDVDGDLVAALPVLRDAVALRPTLAVTVLPHAVRASRRLGILGRPLPLPPEEARPRGLRHSRRRDAEVVAHHYDVGNEFYELVLGPSLTYSCARFPHPEATLEEAQAAKHETIVRKLGLAGRPGSRLLDVGCGWGSLAIHAAREHGIQAVGITISREQATLAQQRAEEAGVADLVEIRLQDYRDLSGEQFDGIASVGMFEHVGQKRMATYFTVLHDQLRPGGRLLNHAISSVGGSRLGPRSFTGRYVFPDGELLDVGETALAMERAGFEVRDVESLREHYARTLRCWVARLEARWDDGVRLVGERRARIWRLYMAASAVGFDDGGISVHQVLGVATTHDGRAGMPFTRDLWVSSD